MLIAIYFVEVKDYRVLAVALLIALSTAGLTLYLLELVQPKKPVHTYEEITNMTKEELVNLIMENQAAEKGIGKLIFPLSVVLASVLAALASFYLCKQSSVDRDVLQYLLRPDEKRIIELLAEHGGEMKQSELVALSKMNKVKVHRLLKQMEQRDLVETVRVGKYNIVRMNKEVLRVF